MSKVSMEVGGTSKNRRTVWSFKDEEYVADFCLVTKRILDTDDYKIFNYHYLLGADWKLCCRKLKMDRGTFFHSVYRIQQKLGKAFREIEPYALYPLNEYFHSSIARSHSKVISALPMTSGARLNARVPLKQVA